MTTIMVSHHRSEMSAIADQLAVVIGGQIRQFGSAQEVMDHPRDDDVARAIGTHPE
jgi:ABC-type sugar transport system ATPase subunit